MVRYRFGLLQASSSTSQDCENTGSHQCHADSHCEESAAVNKVTKTNAQSLRLHYLNLKTHPYKLSSVQRLTTITLLQLGRNIVN